MALWESQFAQNSSLFSLERTLPFLRKNALIFEKIDFR
jgi:hypothetical protein